ncbi:type II toxin-antitoxin system CcdA family antitoxin [Providencia rettgeri]|uniref:type II toxin-antitoxin system CcdA family antitoxin n=1 Tax=Providencia TaxID=586 RepID=UPI001B38BD6F|nr:MULTISPECIES: type II toxin-antitoxin system CcdA family antitoxin [Providencia]EHZ7765170.1 type II toxin-antitoxin system CcdA family antitoxin [Providencia rettgeri]EIJ7168312.1 type II toxin-antitoxin system CcdA family antitoxin [Providencia rettgeri]EJD6048496.1 type II toxin-antitoxin system CcdA family antitoxin [Providencia rettgeri]ELH9585604.1 type II toxin-antitoxin system CcdA family antitoxin [Providencia rettgeri]ELM3938964.1 type II toxin-antitoxin system CcdA family antitox
MCIGVIVVNRSTARINTKKSTNVYLTASLVDKARSMDMNLSATLDLLLAQAIEAKSIEREKEKEDIQAMNQFMVKSGVLTDDDFFGSL